MYLSTTSQKGKSRLFSLLDKARSLLPRPFPAPRHWLRLAGVSFSVCLIFPHPQLARMCQQMMGPFPHGSTEARSLGQAVRLPTVHHAATVGRLIERTYCSFSLRLTLPLLICQFATGHSSLLIVTALAHKIPIPNVDHWSSRQ